MINKLSFTSIALCLFVLSACQSSAKKTCLELNWRSEGESLALNGETFNSSLKKLNLRCKKIVTKAETDNFEEGFQRGLAMLCTTQKGYDYGAGGKAYQATCPDFKKTNFLKGYYKGRLEFLMTELKKVEGLYNSSEERVWRKEREYTIIQNQDPERAKLEADVLESYREEARSLAQLSLNLKKEISETKRLSAESFF